MTVPDFQSLTLPVLKEFADGIAAQGVINTGAVANMPVPVPSWQFERTFLAGSWLMTS